MKFSAGKLEFHFLFLLKLIELIDGETASNVAKAERYTITPMTLKKFFHQIRIWKVEEVSFPVQHSDAVAEETTSITCKKNLTTIRNAKVG